MRQLSAVRLSGAQWASPTRWSLRGRVMLQIAVRETRDGLFSWSFYLTASVAVLASALLTYNAMRFVDESGLQVVNRPFYYPLLIATTLAALYLAGWGTLSIARPRDQGSLRVLFFAPVDGAGLLAGHWLAGLMIYMLLMVVTVPMLVLLGLLSNLPFPTTLIVGLLVSPAMAGPAIAAGLFVSSIAPSSRGALFLLVGILALLVAIEVAYGALVNIPSTSRYYDALSFLRDLLRGARSLLGWVSPFALLSAGLDAAIRTSWRSLAMQGLGGMVGSVFWLILATWAMRHRGVLP